MESKQASILLAIDEAIFRAMDKLNPQPLEAPRKRREIQQARRLARRNRERATFPTIRGITG